MPCPALPAAETYQAAQNLLTPHAPEAYPGITVVRPGPRWPAVICAADGQTVTARGGERVYGFESPTGASAKGFVLGPGDRATKVRSDLAFYLAEWRVERAAAPETGR